MVAILLTTILVLAVIVFGFLLSIFTILFLGKFMFKSMGKILRGLTNKLIGKPWSHKWRKNK